MCSLQRTQNMFFLWFYVRFIIYLIVTLNQLIYLIWKKRILFSELHSNDLFSMKKNVSFAEIAEFNFWNFVRHRFDDFLRCNDKCPKSFLYSTAVVIPFNNCLLMFFDRMSILASLKRVSWMFSQGDIFYSTIYLCVFLVDLFSHWTLNPLYSRKM